MLNHATADVELTTFQGKDLIQNFIFFPEPSTHTNKNEENKDN
tara:strand:+ start:13891 stop:14019 length:129 start_codon:yes stop_codon:yes gene_type:complete